MSENLQYRISSDVKSSICFISAALFSWTVGWFEFSYSWVLGAAVLGICWKRKCDEKKKKYAFLKEITRNEEEFVLKNIKHLPSWVCFPDVEKAEWVNQMVKQLWPFISTMVSDILKNKVEPEMIKKLPSALKSLKFTKADLGNQPLRTGGIRVYTEHVRPNEIIADIDVIYAGDAVIEVAMDNGIAAGISDVQLRGTMRLEMKPLLSKSPLVGGISLYFLNTPDLSYNLTNILNFLDIPGISDILKGVLTEVLESFIVTPNRIKIPLGDTKDLQSFMFPLPVGVLKIQVKEAKNLHATDKKMFKKDSSDPYVIVKVGSQTFKTEVIEDTLNPKWKNAANNFFIESTLGKKINFEVFDKDSYADDFLGRAEIDLQDILHSTSKNIWLPLKGDSAGKGEVRVNCGWFEFSDDPKHLAPGDGMLSKSCLFVKLNYAKGLPAVNMEAGTSSPYVEMTVNGKTQQSKTQRHTIKPVWEEVFQFIIQDPSKTELKLKVFDESSEDALGTLDYDVAKLIDQPGMQLEQGFVLKDCFESCEVFMKLELKAFVEAHEEK